MPKEAEWKLRFDPNRWEVILPPKEIEKFKRSISRGPNLQQIEHCHYACSIEEMWRRSPVFYMRIPICDKGNTREWPTGEVGQHLSIGFPVAIFQSRRIDENEFDFVGMIRVGEDFTSLEIEIHNYSVQNRDGWVVMSSVTYETIIHLWKQHIFETL